MQLMKPRRLPAGSGCCAGNRQTGLCIRFHRHRAVPERGCEGDTIADLLHVFAGEPAPLRTRDRVPSPRGLESVTAREFWVRSPNGT